MLVKKEKELVIGEMLISQLTLDADKGLLFWKEPRQRRNIHKPVGTVSKTLGYVQVAIWHDEKCYIFNAHRLVWRIYYGEWPSLFLDHIDKNRANNSIHNLREVTTSQNHLNRKTAFTTKTGCLNIFQTPSGKYRFTLTKEGELLERKLFDTLDEARDYRDIKRKEHGFSPAVDRADE